jgi:peptide deformylase
MTILPILIHPDPVLRRKADTVSQITPDILKLLDDMLDTMYAAPGIGLAAPQIGVSKRLVVLDVDGGRDGKANNPIKMINPEVIAFGDEKTVLEEGCLSLPEMMIDVARPDIATVRYMDIDGQTQEITGQGLLSKALQHEIDHLDGKLIFDYLSPLRRNIVLRRYNKMLKNAEE